MLHYHLIQYSLVLAICTYLVNYYAAKSVSWHIKFWSIITWTLNFAIALLVPQDVYQSLTNPYYREIQKRDDRFTIIGWQYLILYWFVYILTWTVIPVLQQWENSGDLKSSDRLKRSLKSNGIFYLQMLIGAIVFLVILILTGAGGKMGLITFLKCLATIWGLLLLMSLMGYALVQIPKTLWKNADPEIFLRYIYKKVVEMEDQLEQAYQQFTKVTGYILYLESKSSSDPQIKVYCEQSRKIIPEDYKEKINNKNYHQFLEQINYTKQYPICLQSAIEHYRLLKRSIAHCRRTQRFFQYYCKLAILYEDILQSFQNYQIRTSKIQQENQMISGQKLSKNQQLGAGAQIPSEKESLLNKERGFGGIKQLKTSLFQVKWYHSLWYMHIRRYFNRTIGILLGACSILMLICQTQVFLTQQASILRWLLRIQDYQILRIVIFLIIVFIMYMVNYSLFRLKLANVYGLYYKDSDGPSLMFATINFSRVGVVIVLNFFDMMKIDSEYKHVMGTINMGLLGQWIIKGLPGVLWLIALTHYFNVWGIIVSKLKLTDALAFSTHNVQKDQILQKSPYAVLKKRMKIVLS